jgi:arylsulfatase A-like enzyme
MLRKTAVLSFCAAAAIFSVTPLSQAIAQELKRPNFVTIVIDDMGFSDLSYFGGEVPTPNLDQLVEGGIALTNFYSAPTSTPSRAQFFTGKDHHQVGIGDMAGIMAARGDQQLAQQPGYEGVLSKDAPTFAEVLQQNGYQTMMTGKWDMGEKSDQDAHVRGFEMTKGLLLPGGDTHYISDENGKVNTTLPPSYYQYLNRTSPYSENGQEVTQFPPNAYSTEYYTDSAIALLQNRDISRPFALNVAHIAPHTPWQAPPEVSAKYIETYSTGWDVLRQERFERLKAGGILPADAELPSRPQGLRAWDSLTPTEQSVEAKRMAVYAAMIEMLDNSVGKLLNYLKTSGEYENTVILVYSDNGAESVAAALAYEPSRSATIKNFNTLEAGDFDPNKLANIGDASWYLGPNKEWAMLSNTPFNKHKVTLFDGGFHVPAFIHYPQAKVSGIKYDCMHSILDFMPTILDMADTSYPTTWNGKPLSPLPGVSMAELFQGNFSCNADRWLTLEFEGMKAVRHAGWALSQDRFDDTLHLFNLEQDPYERNDLAAQRPDKLAELFDHYQQYAKENQVFEVSGKWYPPLNTVSTATANTDAGVYGGVASNGIPVWLKAVNAKQSDIFDVGGFVRIAKEHVGNPGEFFVHIKYTPSDDMPPVYFALTDQGLHKQSTAEGLPTFKAGTLPRSLPIPIYQGTLVDIPGTFEILIGYRVDGTEVLGSDPIILTVE